MSTATVRMANGVEMTREAYDLLGYPKPVSDTLPYVGDADCNLVRTRGQKAAVLAPLHGQVGFYFLEEVGAIVAALVADGIEIHVLPPAVSA